MKKPFYSILISILILGLTACAESHAVVLESSSISQNDAVEIITEVETETARRYSSKGTPYADDKGIALANSINLIKVDSSAINRLGYSSKDEVMLVEFYDSGQYLYYGVPYSEYDALLGADSIGSYYNTHIKETFECEKVK